MNKNGDWAKNLVNMFSQCSDHEGASIALSIYRGLSSGEPLSFDKIGELSSIDGVTIRKVVKEWPSVYFDDHERIIGFWGLTINPISDHILTVGGIDLYAWCAWDTLFIPELLGRPANIRSKCRTTGSEIKLVVDENEIKNISPRSVVLSFIECEKIDDNLISSFCHYIHFFADTASAEKYISEAKDTFILSLSDAYEVGIMKNKHQFGELLSAQSS
jgi:alkylmercury lyase